jgi:hypothetical protein
LYFSLETIYRAQNKILPPTKHDSTKVSPSIVEGIFLQLISKIINREMYSQA